MNFIRYEKIQNLVMKTTMKQISLACVLFFIATGMSSAQFKIGATAGISSSTQSDLGNIWDNNGIYSNFRGGLSAEYQFNNWFALKTDALFTQKGRSIDENILGVEINHTDKFSYLEVPVKAKFFSEIGKQKIFGAVGPYAAFLLDAKKEVGDISIDLGDQVKNTDFGVAFQIGCEIPISKNALQFTVNYDMGLTKIAEYDDDLRNKSFSLSVGWLF
jgi:hypothetical protein